MLFNEPKLLKWVPMREVIERLDVSVLFNEPKLLKFGEVAMTEELRFGFSALQRAEIAEIRMSVIDGAVNAGVSVLFNEPKLLK